MIKKIISFLRQEIPIIVLVYTYVEVMLWAITKSEIHVLLHTFPYLGSFLNNEKVINLFLILFSGKGDFFAITGIFIFGLLCFLIPYTYIILVSFITSIIAFKSLNKLSPFQKVGLQYEGGIKDHTKFIATWIAIYSSLNLILHFCGIENFIYYKLAFQIQFLTFYWLVRGQKFGFKMASKPAPLNL